MFQRLFHPRRRIPVFWHENYRLPLTGLELAGRFEPRRSDYALWYLLSARVLRERFIQRPAPIEFADVARVHGAEYIESLLQPLTLASIFAVDSSDIPVDALLDGIRIGCGGTLEAAKVALERKGPAVNLSGGFHHAGRSRGGGFCAFNDVAIAIAHLREHGFKGRIAILDVDAHSPDGTADCIGDDPKIWHGGISGPAGEPLGLVHEIVLPEGTDDAQYLAALDDLLKELPKVELAFVLAGGDVLAADPHGRLGLSLEGVRKRDAAIHEALDGVPTVWLAAGGYRPDAWKVLAGSALVVAGETAHEISPAFNPLESRFERLSRRLVPASLRGEDPKPDDFGLSNADFEGQLRVGPVGAPKLLDFYTPQGIEYALYRYGILGFLERVGYRNFTVRIQRTEAGDHVALRGDAEDGTTYVLIEGVLARKTEGDRDFLYVNWLTLRHPKARFSPGRPPLPGQEVPGLGLSREIHEVLRRMAQRLELAGILLAPAYFHLAFISQANFRFVTPERQGRFEALRRDLRHLSMYEATRAVAEGRVRMNGKPYTWEPEPMIAELEPTKLNAEAVAKERERVRFEVG